MSSIFIISLLMIPFATSSPVLPTLSTRITTPSENQPDRNNRQIHPEYADDVVIAPLQPINQMEADIDKYDLDNGDKIIDANVIIPEPNAEPDEIMHTAEHLVFRPLFAYRKLQEKRKRLYRTKESTPPSTNNVVRRASSYYSTPPRIVYPYYYYSYPSPSNYYNYYYP